jgi:hypothetical protein
MAVDSRYLAMTSVLSHQLLSPSVALASVALATFSEFDNFLSRTPLNSSGDIGAHTGRTRIGVSPVLKYESAQTSYDVFLMLSYLLKAEGTS